MRIHKPPFANSRPARRILGQTRHAHIRVLWQTRHPRRVVRRTRTTTTRTSSALLARSNRSCRRLFPFPLSIRRSFTFTKPRLGSWRATGTGSGRRTLAHLQRLSRRPSFALVPRARRRGRGRCCAGRERRLSIRAHCRCTGRPSGGRRARAAHFLNIRPFPLRIHRIRKRAALRLGFGS